MKTLKPIFSILLSLIPFCAAVSCRAQAFSDVLENDLLENAVRLSPRVLEYVPDGFESSVYVWRDSLAIVLNTADGKECMNILEVFRIQDWSILFRTGLSSERLCPTAQGPGSSFTCRARWAETASYSSI